MNNEQIMRLVMNVMKLDAEILISPLMADLPPDPEACLECEHHKNHSKFDGDDVLHCYMFKELPDSLCMQFKKARK